MKFSGRKLRFSQGQGCFNVLRTTASILERFLKMSKDDQAWARILARQRLAKLVVGGLAVEARTAAPANDEEILDVDCFWPDTDDELEQIVPDSKLQHHEVAMA